MELQAQIVWFGIVALVFLAVQVHTLNGFWIENKHGSLLENREDYQGITEDVSNTPEKRGHSWWCTFCDLRKIIDKKYRQEAVSRLTRGIRKSSRYMW